MEYGVGRLKGSSYQLGGQLRSCGPFPPIRKKWATLARFFRLFAGSKRASGFRDQVGSRLGTIFLERSIMPARVELFGVEMDALRMDQAVAQIQAWVADPGACCRFVVTP